MAPNARIVTYYVRTDGEVVTDSISFNVAGVFQNQVCKFSATRNCSSLSKEISQIAV